MLVQYGKSGFINEESRQIHYQVQMKVRLHSGEEFWRKADCMEYYTLNFYRDIKEAKKALQQIKAAWREYDFSKCKVNFYKSTEFRIVRKEIIETAWEEVKQ